MITSSTEQPSNSQRRRKFRTKCMITSNCKNYFHSNIANPKMQEALYRMVGVQETHQNMLLHHSSVKTAELFPQSLEGTVNPVVTKRGSIIQRKAIAISTIPKCCHLARASNDTRRTDCDASFLSRNSSSSSPPYNAFCSELRIPAFIIK